ncbi:hypothetical protein SR18_gp009 [Caulobacter phage SR18]|nr:hypothetical protein SR18_gp009 [Caulobacter phage SR18]
MEVKGINRRPGDWWVDLPVAPEGYKWVGSRTGRWASKKFDADLFANIRPSFIGADPASNIVIDELAQMDFSKIEERILAQLAGKRTVFDFTAKRNGPTMDNYTIEPAQHGGYIVQTKPGMGYPFELLFAGSRAQCLAFIDQQYADAEKLKAEQEAEKAKQAQIEAQVDKLRSGVSSYDDEA